MHHDWAVTAPVLGVLCSSSDFVSFPEVIHERDKYYPSFLGPHTARSHIKSRRRLLALKTEEVNNVKEVLLLKSSSSPSPSSTATTTTTYGLGGSAVLYFVSFGLDLRFSDLDLNLYCEKERLREDQFEQLKMLVDIGDILGTCGLIKRTEKGELSVCVNSFGILTKSLLPLPDKYHGLTYIDKRYRQRYVDMIANSEVANLFHAKAKLVKVRSKISGHIYSLRSLGRKKRTYVDPDSSTS
ncbi:hypothetical protein Syun_005810 [Stephania yunnanensis]|uniref:Uncharacterized protein n=1 Tax=Stephania yunnanensis TaxID=152371 RepID=A0AAP0KX51_9MAGN